MKEEFKHLILNLGDVSMEEQLGVYYIDMRPSKVHYTEDLYGGGFDENEVPKTGKGYFPINIAQYCFILHAEYLGNQDKKTLKLLKNNIDKLEELQTEDEENCVWWHSHDKTRFGMDLPWASAMAQGEGISAYLRYYQITGEEKYLNYAKKAFHFMHTETSKKGVRRRDENGYLWLEEYPSEPPSYVLNGFIYALFGIYDLYRITKDEKAKQDIEECIRTLKDNIHRYDTGYWSIYDLRFKELVRYYYQKNVHVPQLEILYRLTGEEVFLKYKKKWEKTVNPFNYTFVKIMYRVLPRWRAKSWRL